MNHLNELILSNDWNLILQWAKTLSDAERYESLSYLKNLDIDTLMDTPRPTNYSKSYYSKRELLSNANKYMQVVCTRHAADLKLTAPEWDKNWSIVHFYLTNPGYEAEAILEYFRLFKPDYLDRVISVLKGERQSNINFPVLWGLYKEGLVAFDEETFVFSLFIISMFNRSTPREVEFLKKNPEAIDKVLMQFYKYEIPVLDISKWETYTKECVCEKCTKYWDEVFEKLLEEAYLTDRSIIGCLIDTLSRPFKKGHLDWHIRLIKLFKPTLQEYLQYQESLFTAFYSTNNTVSNFVTQTLAGIYKEDSFNAVSFIDNVSPLFSREKCDKAILLALDMFEWLFKHQSGLSTRAAVIADSLVQPNEKIQVKAACLLNQYLDKQELEPIVEMYAAGLKEEARRILAIDTKEIVLEEIETPVLEHTLLVVPDTWEDLLFHLGKTIKSQAPTDIDLFFQGLIDLQDQLPANYLDQFKPYIKQLSKADVEKAVLQYLYEFFDNWTSAKHKYNIHASHIKNEYNILPFLRNRNQWVLKKLKKKSKLPLLSTPTHTPFYVDADLLIQRLDKYEQEKTVPEMEDLIVACNRILSFELSEESKETLSKLKGDYIKPLHYLFGLTDVLEPDEKLLPLYTQVARTRYPEGRFDVFKQTSAHAYPSVVAPFIIDLTVSRFYSDDKEWHWDQIQLEHNWNRNYWVSKHTPTYPPLFYYLAYNRLPEEKEGYQPDEVMAYALSLIPRYIDAYMAKDTPAHSEDYDGSYILNFLIENQLPIYHSGWIYIASILVTQHKTSRLLAAEYINLMIGLGRLNQELAADYIGTVIIGKYAPINRLMEYVDKPASNNIKKFQLLMLEKCIEKADKEDLPTNFKKIVKAYREISALLQYKPKEDVEKKMTTFEGKKK